MSIKNSIRTIVTAVTVLAMTLWFVPTLAGDDHDLPWWGQGGMTNSLAWNYDDHANPDEPYIAITPSYFAQRALSVTVTGDMEYMPEYGTYGIRAGGRGLKVGTAEKEIPNGYVDGNKKYLTIQYDVKKTGNSSSADVDVEPDPPSATVGRWGMSRPAKDLGNGRTRHWAYRVIDPQPESEKVIIKVWVNEGEEVQIDNVEVTTHCGNEPPTDENAHFHGHDFGGDEWPPDAPFESVPAWYMGTVWERSGSFPPVWMPLPSVNDEFIGVMGLPGGFVADGVISVQLDELAEPDGVKHVACQFDFYMAEGGMISWEQEVSPGTLVENYNESIEDVGEGWQRCLVRFDVSPPPDWEVFRWLMFTDPGSGPVAIDNVFMSAGSVLPTNWFDGFEIYDTESNLHGQRGWKGWDNNPAAGAFATVDETYQRCQVVDVVADTDLVREFEGFTSDKWAFSTWQYIPSDFDSGSTEPMAGSYLVMMSTYVDGGPHEDSDWSVQMNFDSNDGMLKVYHGNGLNTVDVPYIPDEWIEISVKIDLDIDACKIYYNGEFIVEYSWTGGVLGGGGGELDIAAVNLFACDSTSIYYDDLWLRPAPSPGDMNCDGEVDFDDVAPLVSCLTNATGYIEMYPDCPGENADLNNDGQADGRDIQEFVSVLIGD